MEGDGFTSTEGQTIWYFATQVQCRQMRQISIRLRGMTVPPLSTQACPLCHIFRTYIFASAKREIGGKNDRYFSVCEAVKLSFAFRPCTCNWPLWNVLVWARHHRPWSWLPSTVHAVCWPWAACQWGASSGALYPPSSPYWGHVRP